MRSVLRRSEIRLDDDWRRNVAAGVLDAFTDSRCKWSALLMICLFVSHELIITKWIIIIINHYFALLVESCQICLYVCIKCCTLSGMTQNSKQVCP